MGADVVIATPGRLISHLMNSRVDLSHVDYLILDEADRMLDMGFYDDIMQIVSYMPKSRQTLMFSATLPPKIRQMAKQILNDPAEVNIAISKPNEAIEQVLISVTRAKSWGSSARCSPGLRSPRRSFSPLPNKRSRSWPIRSSV